MKINFKKLLIYVIITFFIGSFFTLFVDNISLYDNLKTPIDIPGFIFPVVWSILYLLMGISVYLISESDDVNKNKAIKLYFVQLIVNSLWTLIFFGFRLYTLGFFWIILLLILVIFMVVTFYKINRLAGIMNIPYIIWLIFAAYLNLSIILLN